MQKKIMMKNSKLKFSEYMQKISWSKRFGKFVLIVFPSDSIPDKAWVVFGSITLLNSFFGTPIILTISFTFFPRPCLLT